LRQSRISEIRRLADESTSPDNAKRLSTKTNCIAGWIFSKTNSARTLAHYFQIILKTKNLKSHLTQKKTI